MKASLAVKKKKVIHLRLIKKGRSKRVSVSYFKLIIAGVLVVSIIALGQVIQYSLFNQYSLQNSEMEMEINSLMQEQQELRSSILSLKSPLRVEKIAKAELKMVKPTEVGYISYEVENINKELALKR